MRRRPLLILTLIACALSPLVSGCGNLTGAPQATPPVVDAVDVKRRSLEIQHQIADLFPANYTKSNEYRGPDAETPRVLFTCSPILSEQYWEAEAEEVGVQYTGSFSVQLDEGAPVESIVDQIYQDLINSPEIDLVEKVIPKHPTEGTTLYTTDGYEIMLSYVLPDDSNRYSVAVYAWSPCFIPETMPPSGKI